MKTIGIIGIYKKEEINQYNRLAFNYSEKVEMAGAFVIIIPCNTQNIDFYIEKCDGFIIPGGDDIDPSLYGETINGSQTTYKQNDVFLINFIKKIIIHKKPLLGICKGMQIINIYFGGTLEQDIKNAKFHYQYEKQYDIIDTIKIYKNSFLNKIFKTHIVGINSIHHQAIKLLGKDLDIVANSIHDDTIEAIEHKKLPVFGVQWHPECIQEHQKIFDWFIEQ